MSFNLIVRYILTTYLLLSVLLHIHQANSNYIVTHDAYCPREISFVFEGNARKKIVKKMQLNLPKPSKQLFCLVSALIPPENMCADIRYVSIYSEIGTSS